MLCCVCGCNNYNNKNKNKKLKKPNVSFFVFPKDPKLLKKWIRFCKQKDNFNPKNKRICSDHFTADDMETNFQFELGITNKKRLRLKPGSVPSLYLPKRKDYLTERSLRAQTKENKRIVRELLGEVSNQEDLDEEEEEVEEDESEEEYEKDEVEMDCIETVYLPSDPSDPCGERFCEKCEKCEEFKIQIKELRLGMETTEIELKNKIKSLELELKQNKTQKTNIEEKLSKVFTNRQIKMFGSKVTKKNSHWTEADIASSINLYTSSVKVYKLLKTNDFPLPAVRTLQRWAQNHPEKYANCRRKAITGDVDQEASKECGFTTQELEIEKVFNFLDAQIMSE